MCAQAMPQPVDPADFASHRLTCETPLRLTHDCSIWQGATRPIAFGDYRMSLAAGGGGRTILMSRVREAPDHNGLAFGADMIGRSSKQRAIRAIELISGALEGRGIHLQRVHPVQRGRRVDAYYLQFSDNAYEYLKQFTVLESGHWPSSQARGH
ncbi:MAG: hypothetical protein H6957_05595 [Chromatiaceae bacterium]|nr:hypothetical protein [Chromatiaceae bacterium]